MKSFRALQTPSIVREKRTLQSDLATEDWLRLEITQSFTGSFQNEGGVWLFIIFCQAETTEVHFLSTCNNDSARVVQIGQTSSKLIWWCFLKTLVGSTRRATFQSKKHNLSWPFQHQIFLKRLDELITKSWLIKNLQARDILKLPSGDSFQLISSSPRLPKGGHKPWIYSTISWDKNWDMCLKSHWPFPSTKKVTHISFVRCCWLWGITSTRGPWLGTQSNHHLLSIPNLTKHLSRNDKFLAII